MNEFCPARCGKCSSGSRTGWCCCFMLLFFVALFAILSAAAPSARTGALKGACSWTAVSQTDIVDGLSTAALADPDLFQATWVEGKKARSYPIARAAERIGFPVGEFRARPILSARL